MRLLDRILSVGIGVHSEQARGLTDNLFSILKGSQLVVIDNVADYYFGQRVDDLLTVSDFPCVMLPFEHCFMEFRVPAQYRKTTGWDEVGVSMFMTEDVDSLRNNFPVITNQQDVKYVLVAYYFIRLVGSKTSTLVSQILLPVGIQGQIISPAQGLVHGYSQLLVEGYYGQEIEDMIKNIYIHACFPTLLGLSFMHCRNVKMKEEVPPPKLSKSHQKKKGRTLLRYHILVIDHMKQVLECEGHASKEGLKKALHICRGHFATYGMGGKGLLFGKHAGRIWVPMHTRGSAEKGVVVKDYDVT